MTFLLNVNSYGIQQAEYFEPSIMYLTDLLLVYLLKSVDKLHIQIVEADLLSPDHSNHLLELLTLYSKDIMGGGEELSLYVKENLIKNLHKIPGRVILLAYHNANPVGLAIAFEGFSTFHAKPLLNIHDFVVRPDYRGKGIAKLVLQRIEQIAKEKGYCKLTLEVLEGNSRAQKVYKSFGFSSYELDEQMGKALFWDKKLI